MEKYLERILKLLWIPTILLVFYFSTQLHSLKISYEFERFFPLGDPALTYYENHRKTFGSDNDFLFVTILNNKGIFKSDFLRKLEAVTQELSSTEYIRQVISPTRLSDWVIGPFGPIEIPAIHIQEPSRYLQDSARIWQNKKWMGQFFAQNGQAVCLLIQHPEVLSKKKSDVLLSKVQAIIDQADFEKVYYTGRIHGQKIYLEKIESEMGFFFISAFLSVLILLWWSFKRWFWMVLPLLVVICTMISLAFVMVWLEQPIEIISIILPTILFVVGVSDAVHLISQYQNIRGFQSNAYSALKTCVKDIGLATFLTSLTTAVGFISLYWIPIRPIQSMGLFACLGVCLAFIFTYLLVPSFILFFDPSVPAPQSLKKSWRNVLQKLFCWIFRNPKKIIYSTVVINLICLGSLFYLKVDQYLLEDISDRDPIKQGYLYHEIHFSGARPFELGLKIHPDKCWDLKTLQTIDAMSQYLKTHYGVSSLFSYIDLIKNINQAMHGGNKAFETIPKTQAEIQKIRHLAIKHIPTSTWKSLINTEAGNVRMSGKMPDYGAQTCKKKNEAFYGFIKSQNLTFLNPQITGMGHLMDQNNFHLIKNMLQGILLSVMVIVIIMLWIFKRLWIIPVSLIPNLIPLIIIGGFISLSQDHLNTSSAIIFTIAFGIAVDDTIHFLMSFKQQKSPSVIWRLRNTFIKTGKALVLTSVILSGGFLSLIFSSFASISNIGALISITLFVALLADLMLLPLLIYFFKK